MTDKFDTTQMNEEDRELHEWFKSHDTTTYKELFGKAYDYAKKTTIKDMKNYSFNVDVCTRLKRKEHLRVLINYYQYHIFKTLNKLPLIGKWFEKAMDDTAIRVFFAAGSYDGYLEVISNRIGKE